MKWDAGFFVWSKQGNKVIIKGKNSEQIVSQLTVLAEGSVILLAANLTLVGLTAIHFI